MEELDTNAQQRRETFARYGLAMYQAQCVEKSIAILVSNVFNEEFLPSGPDHREIIQEKVFAKTLGHLLSYLRKQIAVPPNLDHNLAEALRKRNWLAHEYFWDRAAELLTIPGREKMIDELTMLSEFFSKLDSHLTLTYEKWARKVGITEELVEKELKALIQSAEEK
ncbi:MAG: hypothetical protein Q7N50_11485 [Armatimonadota bacterium]|nr:hypothetical protein [Armatimonadota bacterium]